MTRPIAELALTAVSRTPLVRTLWRRRRFAVERALLRGKSPSRSEHPSIVHFSMNKAATQFVKSILRRSGEEIGMVPADLHALAFASPLPYFDDLSAAEMSRYAHVFRPRGYVYTPFGGPIDGVTFDGFRPILMVRDPRDLLVSEYFSIAFSHMLPPDRTKRLEFAERRRFAIENGIDAYVLRQCGHTRRIFERYALSLLGRPNVHFTKYETMIDDFGGWLRGLLAFCELAPGEALMRAFLEEGTAPAPSAEDRRSHRRQVSSGDYLRKLKAETIAQLDESLGEVLVQFGYETTAFTSAGFGTASAILPAGVSRESAGRIAGATQSTALDIVVCCHDDSALLPNLLEALTQQTAARDTFRVIVVDNASTDNPRAVLAKYEGRLTIDYVFEPTLGLNRARNAGYAHARSAFVAHIDADTIPDPQWVEAILDVAGNINCDLFGGPYRPYYPSPKPDWFLDAFMSRDFGPVAKFLDRDHPYGMNMIWRREIVEQLGGFATDLGLHGRGLRRGDETELVTRAHKMLPRFAVYYDPRISVRTAVRPELFSLRYWAGRKFEQGRICRETAGNRAPGLSWPWPLRGLLASGLFVVMLAKSLVWPGPHTKTAILRDALPPLFHVGSAYQDLLSLFSHKRR